MTLRRSSRRRVGDLPTDTQTLLLPAADQPGPGDRLWQAATALGIPESAVVPAEAAGLVVFWPEVRFSHPLVRSAVYHAATPVQRRRAHRALAAACDPELPAVPRAWHLAAAARPGEGVAVQLEAAADRARSRGGYATAAALLERAALLTPDGKVASRAAAVGNGRPPPDRQGGTAAPIPRML